MYLPQAGLPPSSISAYVEDMLNELADMAERIDELSLAAAIRQAGLTAAGVNSRAWLERHDPSEGSER